MYIIITSASKGLLTTLPNFLPITSSNPSIKTLLSRLKGNFSSRPLLKDKKLKDEIIKILNERQKYYNRADYVFEVDNLHINEIVEKIINILNLK